MVDIAKIKLEISKKLQPLNPDKIILFGSFAYGIPNEDSDLDICVIKERVGSTISQKREIRRLLDDIDMPMDIIVVDNEYYQTHSDKNWINTALYEARNRGEILYEKK